MQCIVLDAMGVIFRAADDVAELLVPFIAAHGGVRDATVIQANYLRASVGEISADEFWFAVGLDAPLEDAYLRQHRLMPGAYDFLRRAQANNVPVWCLSNDVARWSAKLRASRGLDALLRGAVISSDVHSRKPDAGIYRALLLSSGFAADELLFVDDRQANVDAARAFGIPTILFDAAMGFAQLDKSVQGMGNDV